MQGHHKKHNPSTYTQRHAPAASSSRQARTAPQYNRSQGQAFSTITVTSTRGTGSHRRQRCIFGDGDEVGTGGRLQACCSCILQQQASGGASQCWRAWLHGCNSCISQQHHHHIIIIIIPACTAASDGLCTSAHIRFPSRDMTQHAVHTYTYTSHQLRGSRGGGADAASPRPPTEQLLPQAPVTDESSHLRCCYVYHPRSPAAAEATPADWARPAVAGMLSQR